ncbi:hypothetical protein ACFL2Q_07715 [Thermodesulfobacteriota bacterium]
MSRLPQSERRPIVSQGFLIAVGFLVAVFVTVLTAGQARAASPERTAAKEVGTESSGKGRVKDGFRELTGRWRRPDGGYVIDIKEVDSTGKMDVAYSNPKPINVSRAEATQEGSTTKVFIELRDAGYPGCTYTLTYDPQTDQLKGIYFQAAIQQNFKVIFFRLK